MYFQNLDRNRIRGRKEGRKIGIKARYDQRLLRGDRKVF
jgi:hypothetical protein